MNTVMQLLRSNPEVSEYKINIHRQESCQLFFVKGKLETVRRTDTCDKEVTVYVRHGEYMGDAKFFIYPSTTREQIEKNIADSVGKAKLICNQNYQLPAGETGAFEVESNFSRFEAMELADLVSQAVFQANTVPGAALNSVEIFINKHTASVVNSRGLEKSQIRYDAMVEAIPTYNGEKQSVELYEQYNFSTYDPHKIREEIAGKLLEVKARYEATQPETMPVCPVVLSALELSELFSSIAFDLHYSNVYSHSNLFKKGDRIQAECTGDPISIRMAGQVPGCVRSTHMDSDGLTLGSIQVVDNGVAVNYFGSNRFGQYLGETPTGDLPCVCVQPGTVTDSALKEMTYLEVLSMSGLQVDFHNDYIGGEVRLAYYHDGDAVRPLTGISISGKLSQVLSHIRLSETTALRDDYSGPAKAILHDMKIF